MTRTPILYSLPAQNRRPSRSLSLLTPAECSNSTETLMMSGGFKIEMYQRHDYLQLSRARLKLYHHTYLAGLGQRSLRLFYTIGARHCTGATLSWRNDRSYGLRFIPTAQFLAGGILRLRIAPPTTLFSTHTFHSHIHP
jgi:hypothetical protein